MNPGQPQNSGSISSHIYFGIGTCFLVLMALMWALDASIVYILLGAASFFFFLGFWKKPRRMVEPEPYRTRHDTRKSASESFFSEMLKNLGKKKSHQQPQSQTSFSGKQVLPYVIFFFASFFLMIIVPFLFSGGDTTEGTDGFYQRAEQFRSDGQYDSADRYYQKALSEDPENVEILNAYGVGMMSRNQYDKAMTVFDQVLQIDPDYEYARYNKALIYHYRHSYRQSLSETFELMERSPDYYDASVLAGDNYYVQQRYDSAIFWYEKGYGNGQRSAALCHVMAYIYDQKGEKGKAVQLYQEALSYDSTRVEIYERLGEFFPGPDGEQYRTLAQRWKSAE